MDVYDPACPTEDDLPFEEIDLSQVPLPPTLPLQGEVLGRDVSSLPSELEREEKRKVRNKKRRRKRNGNRSQPEDAETEDKEDDEPSDQCPVLESAEPLFSEDADDIPVLVPALATDSDDNAQVDLSERDPPILLKPEQATEDILSSAVSAVMTSSAPTTTLGKLHFKLTSDPSSGKAKVSFQLKKSVKSTFHAAGDDDDEGEQVVEEEVKDIVEKTAAGEYIPTRFKVSKKHEIYRPSLVEPGINIVFPPTVISSGVAASSAAQTAKSSTPIGDAKLHEVSKDAEDAAEVKDSKMNEGTKAERETRYNRREEDSKAVEKIRGPVDSPRELRRSERRDKKKEESSFETIESSSRSTRRSSRGGDRDVERHGSLRSSYSRREQSESKYKEMDDKSRKGELVESTEKLGYSRSKRSDSDTRKEEKRGTDRRHGEGDSKHHTNERSPGRDKNTSPSITGSRRTRNSRRNRSPSSEKDGRTHPSSDSLNAAVTNKELAADKLTEESLLDAKSCEKVTETSSGAVEHSNASLVDSSKVIEAKILVESEEKHPHIQKIVIRRSLESNDFEIARNNLIENNSSEESPTNHKLVLPEGSPSNQKSVMPEDSPTDQKSDMPEDSPKDQKSDVSEDSHTDEKTFVSEDSHTNQKLIRSEIKPADKKDSLPSGSEDDIPDSPGKEKYRVREKEGKGEFIDTSEPHAHQRKTEEQVRSGPQVEFDHRVISDKEVVDQELQDQKKYSIEPEDAHKDSAQMDKFQSLPDTGSENAKSDASLDKDLQIAHSMELAAEAPISPRTSLPLSESEHPASVDALMVPDSVSLIAGSQKLVESEVINVACVDSKHEISLHAAESQGLPEKSTCVELVRLPEGSSQGEESETLPERSRHVKEPEKLPARSKHIEKSEKLPAKSKHKEESEMFSAKTQHNVESEKSEKSKYSDESELPTRSKQRIEESERLPEINSQDFESHKSSGRKNRTGELFDVAGSKDLFERSSYVAESQRSHEKRLRSREERNLNKKRSVSPESPKSWGRRSFTADSEEYRKSSSKDGVQKRSERYSYISEPALLPQQVLVDVSALPGKSKWEMDDDDDDEKPGKGVSVTEDRHSVKDFRVMDVSHKWPFHTQKDSMHRQSQRSHKVIESSSNEDERHADKKKDKAEKKLKKKKKHEHKNPSNNTEPAKTTEIKDVVKSKEESSKFDNSKIVSYLKEYSKKEEKTSKAKTEIDSVKLVAYLKEYSGKMVADSSVYDELDSEDRTAAIEDVPETRKPEDDFSPSKSMKAAEKDKAEDDFSEEEAVSSKHKEGSGSDPKGHDSGCVAKIMKVEAESEQKGVKDERDMVSNCSRSSSLESRRKDKNPERLLKKKDESSAALKEKRGRSASSERSESASKSSQRSRERRDRSDSMEGGRTNKRHRSQSPDKSDDKRQVKKRSRSQSPAWRNRDRRNRSSRSMSQDRRSDRRKGSNSPFQDRRRDQRNMSGSQSQDRKSNRRNKTRSPSQEKRSNLRNKSRSLSQEKRSNRRNKSRSLSQEKRSNRRNKSRSPSQGKRSDRRNRSRSHSQDRSSDRRSRSKSQSQDRRNDRRNRSWSRSRERNYSHRSYRSPGRDSYNSRTQRDKRDRKGRSRSDSSERSSARRLQSSEGSPSKSTKYRKRSKTPDKKGKETSSGVKSDKKLKTEQKITLEALSPVSLTSIPIPDEIPLPREELKTSTEKDTKSRRETDGFEKLQDDSVKVPVKHEIKSVVNDPETSDKMSVTEQTEAAKTGTVTSVSVSRASLACGKDRQIKFSILGASKKLQSVLVSGVLVDDDEDDSDGKDEHLDRVSLETSVKTGHGAFRESDTTGNVTDKIQVEQNIPKTSSRELRGDSQKEDKKDEMLVSSTANTDDIKDSKLLDDKESDNDESEESSQKITSSDNKEMPKTVSSPQRLKFKYIPLWEMEETEKRPVFEEVTKGTGKSVGLALDYGSGSSDYEDEDSVTKQWAIEKLEVDESRKQGAIETLEVDKSVKKQGATETQEVEESVRKQGVIETLEVDESRKQGAIETLKDEESVRTQGATETLEFDESVRKQEATETLEDEESVRKQRVMETLEGGHVITQDAMEIPEGEGKVSKQRAMDIPQDEGQVTKQGAMEIPEGESQVTKQGYMEIPVDKDPVKELNESEKSDVRRDRGQNETQKCADIEKPTESLKQDTKLQSFSEKSDSKLDVDLPLIQHKTQLESEEECPDSQSAELHSDNIDSTKVPLESDKEAYSPSHPSMEDSDDVNASETDSQQQSSVVGSRPVSEPNRGPASVSSSDTKRVSSELAVSDCIVSSVNASVNKPDTLCKLPVTVAPPVVTSALGNITTINIASIPLPGMPPPTPHIPQPVNPPVILPSLIRQPFSGLRVPFSLLASPLPVLKPVPPPTPHPVPPPVAFSEMHHTSMPLSVLSAPRPVPPPPQLSTTSGQSGAAFGLPGFSAIPPPSQLISTSDQSGASFGLPGFSAVPPPPQLSTTSSQSGVAFGLPGLSAAPQVPLLGQPSMGLAGMCGVPPPVGVNSQVAGIQGRFQGVPVPRMMAVAPVPPPIQEISLSPSAQPVPPPAVGAMLPSLGAVLGSTIPLLPGALPDRTLPSSIGSLPGGLLPAVGAPPTALSGLVSTGTLPGTTTLSATEVPLRHTLPSVSTDSQPGPHSHTLETPASSVQLQHRVTVNSATSGTQPVRFRINRFHQSPPVTHAIPPPSIAIPVASTLGSSISIPNTTSMPLISVLSSVQQPASLTNTFSKSVDIKLLTTTPVPPQKPPIERPGTATHSKRPKISSILSQPKIDDPSVLNAEIKIASLISSELGSVIVKPGSAQTTDLRAETSASSGKQPPQANDSKAEKAKTDVSTSVDSQIHKASKDEQHGTRNEKPTCFNSLVKDRSDEITQLPTQSSERDMKAPQTAITSTSHKESQDDDSFATQLLVRESIPLPDEVTSSVDSHATPAGSPQPSQKPPLPRAPLLPPKQPPPPPGAPESDSPATTEASSKDQVVSSSQSEKKKRFSQSPLAIGMLPKVQITQSPLAAGPLPKLPPEPEENNSVAALAKRKVSSPVAADAKATIANLAAKQKTVESTSTSKVHFVFKSKTVVQKTLIPAFDDEDSDNNEGEPQTSSSEASHIEKNLTPANPGDKKGVPQSLPASPLVAVGASAAADTEKQVPEKETVTKEVTKCQETKSQTVVSLTDIEAFPVQVITSSRKEEGTAAASWPEFAVAKKRKDEESGRDGKRSHDRDERKKSRRYSPEREKGEDKEHRRKKSRHGREEKKYKRGGSRSDEEDNDDYDSGIKIKKEKEDSYEDSWPGGQDNKSSDKKKGNLHEDDDNDRRRGRDRDSGSYSKRSSYDRDSDYKRKGQDTKGEKYKRRREDREDDYTRRKYDDSRRNRHSERGWSRERSWERDRSREKDKSDKSSSKSSGKRHHRSRDESRSRSRSKSPSRRRGRSRDHSRDKYDRRHDRDRSQSRSRSHSDERGSTRRKSSKTFKEELMEELTKPSMKADPKEDLFKVATIVSSNQTYVSEYQHDASYPSDGTIYHHAPDMSGGYSGQDFNLAAHYPPSYEHQEFTSHWQEQPAHTSYNQMLPPQHQDISGQYPSIPPEQVPTSHLYPFQTPHFPPPNFPNNQILTDPYRPVPSILQQQPQMQHPVSGPPPQSNIHVNQNGQPIPPTTHVHIDQHGQPIATHYPPPSIQVLPPVYTLSGPPNSFQPHIFTPDIRPPITSSEFHLHPGLRTRPPLLPTPVTGPLLRTPLASQNVVEISNFSAPDMVSSPSLQLPPERPPRKSRFSPLEEGTFSPLKSSLVAASSSPTVSSPSTTSVIKGEETYTKSAVSASSEQSVLPEPSFETSLLAESEFDSVDTRKSKKSSQKKSIMDVDEPIVSSSGVEDSTGDTGSDSGTESSSQRPLKVKSRWRSNSEADAVVVTSKQLSSLAKQLLDHGSTKPHNTADLSSYERCTRSRTAAVASTAELDNANLPLVEDPSPSSPSRKRSKTQTEISDLPEKQESDDRTSPEDESKDMEDEPEEDLASIVARPDFPKFEIITENIHLTERKRSKSMKRMLCDCTTCREERSKGITACGSDCLNRMLMIECGSRCPCGDYCTNRRFQKKQYSRTVPFKAGDKGWGLRAAEDMEERGTFIMEYVGELLGYEEFVRRTRQYSKTGLVHHYFMALNADEVIDATLKGSISRFINHSCDPNCETQKWTVNGELRVGFFTRKPVKKGEELTFDYQFEHYGEAQKCYCGAENCRGYIGLVKSPTRNNRRKEKRKKEIFKDELLEEEIEELSLLDGMRNKNHVLDLCRLMVRAEKVQHRMAILKILQDTTESACLRLFLDYHGLPLLWSWMADIGTVDYSAQTQELKLLMLSVLKSLPINNKTALRESKIPDVVERWAVAAVVAARKPPPPPPPATTATTLVTVSTKAADSVANITTVTDNEAIAVSAPVTSVYEAPPAIEDTEEKDAAEEPEATTSSESSPPASPPPLLPSLNTVTPVSILASVKDRTDAKKKRRVTFAEMHEESTFSPDPHEDMDENDDISSSTQGTGDIDGLEGKSADRLLQIELKSDENLSSNMADSTSSSGSASDTDNSDTEALIKDPLASLAAECISHWSSLKEVFKIPKREREKTERELDVLCKKDQETSDPYAKWKRSRGMRLSKKRALEDDDRKSRTPKMSKAERRQLFEAQVKKEDEMAAQAYAEEYQRQQEAYVLHQQRLLDDPQYFYFHQQQQADPNFAGLDPSMIPPEGLQDPLTGQPISNETLVDQNTGQPVIDPNTGQQMIDHNTLQPLMHHPPHIDPNTGQHILHHIDPQTGQPVQHINSLAGQFVQQFDHLTGQPIHQIDPLTGQAVHHIDLLTGQALQQVDPLTGQPLQQIDPLTGQPLQQIDPLTGQPLQQVDPLTGQPLQQIDPLTGQPLQQIDPLTGQPLQQIDPLTGQPLLQIDSLTGQPILPQMDPVTGQLLQHQMESLLPHPNLQHAPQFDPSVEPPHQHQHPVLGQTTPLNFQPQQQPQPQHLPAPPQNTNLLEIDFEEEVPPPPSPPTVPVSKLPPNWKTAKDSEGRVYYYHAFTRQTQWEMPNWEDNDDDSDDMDIDPIPVDEVIKAKKKTTTAAADTSSEVARKIKDHFRSKMSNFIVTYLNPYRKQDCKIGRIVSTDDFKHLARKLTHHVMSKELKHCRHVEDLEVNENVKAKAKDYVRKYMSKFGTTFKKTGSPHPDDPPN